MIAHILYYFSHQGDLVLDPVEFAYKTDSQEKHVGFIAEDAPELVASKDKERYEFNGHCCGFDQGGPGTTVNNC